MKEIKVLDVTLRDGGCVNNFNFGAKSIEKIISAQERSGVDIIELGYIDDKNGSVQERTQYINERVIYQHTLQHKKEGVKYVAMMDYGKFDVTKLESRSVNGIDGIRLAFHKKDRYKVIDLGKTIIEKGYEFYIQPMITLRYTDEELLEFIKIVNNELPGATGMYVVDSFGEMRPADVLRLISLVDHNLSDSMILGFHSHNNLQMSYSNAIAFLQYPTNRRIVLDCSIMGMGKGAGNLNTEILMGHLNLFYGKKYDILPILEVIDKVINQIHSEFYWGYAPEYYLSSMNHCTPTYAGHFYNKHMLPIDQVGELLSMIDESKKISFDKDYAETLYRKYNELKGVEDSETVREIASLIKDKKVLIVAPGKSISIAQAKIDNMTKDNDVFTIGLNMSEGFKFDLTILTRKDEYEKALTKGVNMAVVSSITKGARGGNIKILDYKRWITVQDGETYDSSSVVVFNLLKSLGIKELYLAGFDGFSLDINNNYANPELRFPLSDVQVKKRNKFYRDLINDLRNSGMTINFVTPSLYE